jgi:hypothetical protein
MLGFILSAVGFVLGLIQLSFSYHLSSFWTKSVICGTYASWDTCEDWPTDNADDNADYRDAREWSSASATSSLMISSYNSSAMTGFALIAIFLVNLQIQFGIINKHLDHTVAVILTKVARVFAFVCFLSTCSIVSWNGTYTDELDYDTGDIANAYFAFNIINFLFILALDVLNMMGKSKAGPKN